MWEPVEIPYIPTRVTDEQVIEEFMLEEEETDFQSIDECKIVELQDKQEIEECIVSEPVEVPDMSITVVEEQEIEESINKEECMKEEISDVILPEMCSADGKIHTDELKLGTPKINAVEISEMPSEIKLEMPIEQSESKLMQDMTLVSDVPTPFHNCVQPATEQEFTQQKHCTAHDIMEDFSAKQNYSR